MDATKIELLQSHIMFFTRFCLYKQVLWFAISVIRIILFFEKLCTKKSRTVRIPWYSNLTENNDTSNELVARIQTGNKSY